VSPVLHLGDDFGNQGIFGHKEESKGLQMRNLCKQNLVLTPYLATQEIKQIVDGLNRPPFMCNLSLVDFDDKTP
jgi:hypothetical protein